MKIHFSKREYQKLLEILYITDWVLHAHQEKRTDETKEFQELEQKIMAMAKECGAGDAVETNNATGNYFLSRNFIKEQQCLAPIEAFENATFWEELLERLARRDFIRRYGEEAIRKMTLEERFTKETAILQMYDHEFSQNGLNNIYIQKMKQNTQNNSNPGPINEEKSEDVL
jgi:hypothetical protein